MKKFIFAIAITLMSGSAAYAANPEALAKVAHDCCAALAGCCHEGMDCCND